MSNIKIKARQLLPLLRKWADVYELAPGEEPNFLTIEKDGVQEYVLPENEIWSINDKPITQIDLEGEVGETLYLFIYNNDEYSAFELDEEIDLNILKRYQLVPFSF